MECGFTGDIKLDDELDCHGHLEISITAYHEHEGQDWITRDDAERLIKHLKELFTI